MKKSLIALAVLATSGAAMAQSSVTLYGVADLWVGKVKGSSVQMVDGGVAQSRIGFKGTEDLGGGLTASFNFEQGLNLENGATDPRTFGRQANLGVSGAFGSVKLGRSTTALDDVFGAFNSGFDSALSANAVWQNIDYTDRADSQLYYATPEFAGFSAAASTQLNGDRAAGAGRESSFHVKYANGPIGAAVGYEDDAAGQKGTLVAASYDLGMAKLLGSVYTTKPDAGARTNSYQIGADVPLTSALTLSVGYANSKVKGAETDSAFGVAAAYGLSKRTIVYAGFRAEKRKSALADADVFAVGVNHSF
ncbi:MAG: porin [Hydrogenophaga sp.]|nr:porin [Hydrogenophaga sp.]